MRLPALAIALLLSAHAGPSDAQRAGGRDEFFWLGEINKASAIINTDEGLLDKSMTPLVTAGIAKVLHDGNQPGGKRPTNVITFEPLLSAPLKLVPTCPTGVSAFTLAARPTRARRRSSARCRRR